MVRAPFTLPTNVGAGHCDGFQHGRACVSASEQRVDSQIVGGTEVADGKYPFIVTLQDIRRGDTGYERHICGGTLIAPGYVLTAAPCVFDHDKNNLPTTLIPADQLRVIAGRPCCTAIRVRSVRSRVSPLTRVTKRITHSTRT